MDDVLSAELDFHSHPGASLLPSVRFPNREKVGKFLKNPVPIGMLEQGAMLRQKVVNY